MKRFISPILLLILFLIPVSPLCATTGGVASFVGEHLEYDISFLWFERLAVGEISLERSAEDNTYLIVMQARTLGVAAFFTRDRVERYETLVRVAADGFLEPLWYQSHTIHGSGKSRREKTKRYIFEYDNRQVRYQRLKNGEVYKETFFPMDPDRRLCDILSALYNLRLGYFGVIGTEKIRVPTFHHEGEQDIVIEPLGQVDADDQDFLSASPFRFRVLVDPEVFGTNGRDLYVGLDKQFRPNLGIIKDVIGLGDVRGRLR